MTSLIKIFNLACPFYYFYVCILLAVICLRSVQSRQRVKDLWRNGQSRISELQACSPLKYRYVLDVSHLSYCCTKAIHKVLSEATMKLRCAHFCLRTKIWTCQVCGKQKVVANHPLYLYMCCLNIAILASYNNLKKDMEKVKIQCSVHFKRRLWSSPLSKTLKAF